VSGAPEIRILKAKDGELQEPAERFGLALTEERRAIKVRLFQVTQGIFAIPWGERRGSVFPPLQQYDGGGFSGLGDMCAESRGVGDDIHLSPCTQRRAERVQFREQTARLNAKTDGVRPADHDVC
jgi:hypothetical protein